MNCDGVLITQSQITEGDRTWFYLLQLSVIISLRSAIAMIQAMKEPLLLFLIFYMEVFVVKGSI